MLEILPIFLGGPMGPSRPVWVHVLVSLRKVHGKLKLIKVCLSSDCYTGAETLLRLHRYGDAFAAFGALASHRSSPWEELEVTASLP